MANWSDTEIKLNGNKEDIAKLKAEIKSLIVDDTDLMSSPTDFVMDISPVNYDESDVSLSLRGQGRWFTPESFFINLVEKYDLSGEFHDSEGGEGFYVEIIAEDGMIVKDVSCDYISKEHAEYAGINYFIEEFSDYVLEERDMGKGDTLLALNKIGIHLHDDELLFKEAV